MRTYVSKPLLALLVAGAPALAHGLPDLTLTSVSGPSTGQSGTNISVSATVASAPGTSLSTAPYVRFYLSLDANITVTDYMLGETATGLILPGTSGTATASFKVPSSVPSGTYYVGAIVDLANAIAEADETNNSLAGSTIQVTYVKPDLTLTSVSGPSTGQSGTNISVSATVASAPGTSLSTAPYVRFYLSLDANITVTDYMLGETATGLILPGTSGTATASFKVPSSVPSGTYYVGAIVDLANAIAEADETNNSLAGSTIQVTYVKPDLTLTSVSGPSTGQSGTNISVSATVASAPGTSLSTAPYVRFYLSLDANITVTDYMLGETATGLILPGTSGTATASFKVPSSVPSGTYYVGAIVDLANAIAEADETNNSLAGSTIQVTYVKPDLTLTSVSGPSTGQSGTNISVSATVASAPGTSLSTAPYVRFYLSLDANITVTDYMLGETATGLILPGTSGTATASFKVPSSVPSGTYYVGAIVDLANAIAETDETNNALAGTTITLSKPDLTVSSPSVSPTVAPEGGTVTISAQVQAQTWGTGAFWVGFYLSTDSTISAADRLVASAWVPALPANTPTEVSAQVVLPAMPAGAYRVGAIVDLNGEVSEADESNNATAGMVLMVGVLPDTTPPVLTVDQPQDGGQVTSSVIRVSGRVVDESPVTLRLDGTPVSVALDGSFGQDAYLQAGDNLLTLEAVDAKGNGTTRTLHVGLNAPPLLITVAEPTDGFVTAASQVFVTGSVTGGVRPVQVTVNGQTVQVATNGAFQSYASVAASPVVAVSATDALGATTLALVGGLYDPSLDPGYQVRSAAISGIVFAYDAIGNMTKVVNAATDPSNCGGLDRSCPAFPGAAASCQGGTCGVVVDGAHVDLTSNPAHCGAYNHACGGDPNGSSQCLDGACVLTCSPAYQLVGGRCVDLLSDVDHCGQVGNVCTSQGGTPYCAAGTCRDDGIPLVASINGVGEPGMVFRSQAWAGLVVRGVNLNNVTHVEFEVCGDDSSAPDWSSPAATSCLGEVYGPRLSPDSAGTAISFDATSGQLVIKGQVLQELLHDNDRYGQFWTESWYQLRIHYLDHGLDAFASVNIPFSLEMDPAPCAGPSISGFDIVQGALADYDPTTGRLELQGPIGLLLQRDASGRVVKYPRAVLGRGPGLREQPVLRVAPGNTAGVYMVSDALYIRAGLDPREVLVPGGELYDVVLVYAEDKAPNARVDLGGWTRSRLAGVLLHGACLDYDGGALLTDGFGLPLADTLAATRPLLDRALVDDVTNPRYPLGWVTYSSDRGLATTPGPVHWGKEPGIAVIGPVDWLIPNQPLAVTGDWFVGVRGVSLSSYLSPDEPLALAPGPSPGPGQYVVVNDTTLLINVAGRASGTPWDLRLWFDDCGQPEWVNWVGVVVRTDHGTGGGWRFWIDPAALPPVPNVHGPVQQWCHDPVAPGDDYRKVTLPPITPPCSGSYSNSICLQ